MKKDVTNLSAQIHRSPDPTCKRVVIDIPCEMEKYNITIPQEHVMDFLKVVDALYALDSFVHCDGTTMPKAEMFRTVCSMFNISVLNINQRLNTAYRAATCTRIFHLMSIHGRRQHEGL